ncbi:MAG: hypothetical protein BGO78_15620 [Chloroflexi bacterium 44-23]|nr:MAG: hypothetical protein BGO78_15620 [Chloroflexi bacterium 44-23]
MFHIELFLNKSLLFKKYESSLQETRYNITITIAFIKIFVTLLSIHYEDLEFTVKCQSKIALFSLIFSGLIFFALEF